MRRRPWQGNVPVLCASWEGEMREKERRRGGACELEPHGKGIQPWLEWVIRRENGGPDRRLGSAGPCLVSALPLRSGGHGTIPRPPHCQWTHVLPVPHVLACTLHPHLSTLVILLVLSPNCALERGVLDGLPRVRGLWGRKGKCRLMRRCVIRRPGSTCGNVRVCL